MENNTQEQEKKQTRSTPDHECCGGVSPKEMAINKIKEGFVDLEKEVKKGKKKWAETDEETKKKTILCLTGILAFISGIIGAISIISHSKKDK